MVGSPSCALFASCTPHGAFCATCRVRVPQCSQAFRARHTPGIITQYDRPSTPVAEDALSASPEVWSLCAQCVRRRVHFRHFCTQPCTSWSDDSRGHHTSAGLQQCTRCAATPSWASSHHRLSPELRRSRTVRFHVVRTTFSTDIPCSSNQRDTCQSPSMLCFVSAHTMRMCGHSTVLPCFHGCALPVHHGPVCSLAHSAARRYAS